MNKIIRQKFSRKSTTQILNGLNAKSWEGEEFEAAISILKFRGEDVSAYLSDQETGLETKYENNEPDEVVKATIELLGEDKYEEVNLAIDKILKSENKELIGKFERILGDKPQGPEDFTAEQGEKILKLSKKVGEKPKVVTGKDLQVDLSKGDRLSTTEEVKPKVSKGRKVADLTPKQKEFLDNQLDRLEKKELSKKEVIVGCMEFGITKQQMDRNIDDKTIHWTTVYNIYKEHGK